jgi:hypothetical protein
MGGGHDVDSELERMKLELGGEAPREIEGSAPDAAGNTSTSTSTSTSNGQAGKAADQPQSGDGA